MHGEDRLTLSVDMIFDKEGKLISNTIYKAVINVTKKMTYEKVQQVIDRSNKETLYEYMDYIEDIELMVKLAKILKDKRNKEGSINFDLPESKIILDEREEVSNIEPYKAGFANNVIEEFMLATNKVIAETFFHLEAPFIYRIHEEPDVDKLRELNETLKNLGLNTSIKGINKIHPKSISDVMDEVTNTNDEKKQMVISALILRSLKIAKYSELCLGHFGLAFKYYCHFTSPIRRYPDLFIHRVISEYIENGYNLDETTLSKRYAQAKEYAFISSDSEKIATEIERECDDLYKAKYMKKHVGDEYEGIVSGVTKFGLYIKLDNTVEGLVTMQNLNDDYYIHDEKNMRLIGDRTKKIYELGQKVKIQVIKVNEQLRQIDFEIIGG
ncbi:MAG: RNB domain-containing ribonuclease [Clostridia bacterium]|nr:RNB domain-containing ribonuclease [Clostridia bacterium]MDD4375771.1 RNB domain-containing ribonuclease [Clostridia bacterium]